MKNASVRERFEALIRARSGLHMRAQEAPLLDKTLAARVLVHRFSTPEQYLDFLASDTAQSATEWNFLFVALTNQESYFFRDPGQLAVIREYVLPELLERNRATRTLRIWSAGCSTGEEPYSLAMMVAEMLPREEWRLFILGTDLSETALERARDGLYSAWSFRTLDAPTQQRFFWQRGNKWEVKPHVRQNVTFAQGNLLLDEFPSRVNAMHDMDLIVCRNVFIYFAREAVARVLRKFSATLRTGGFLVTGHTELHDVALGDLQARTFAQSVIYQRPAASQTPRANTFVEAAAVQLPPVAQKTPANPPPPVAQETPPLYPFAARAPGLDSLRSTGEATTLIERGNHAAALQILEAFLKREPRHLGAICLAAQAHANAGHLDKAEALCRAAIGVSAFAPLPYQLLARIADERGDVQNAKVLLKKVIYLDPLSVRSYLELSALYAREGDATRAAQMKRSALGVLEEMEESAPIPMFEFAVEIPLEVGELKRQLQDGD